MCCDTVKVLNHKGREAQGCVRRWQAHKTMLLLLSKVRVHAAMSMCGNYYVTFCCLMPTWHRATQPFQLMPSTKAAPTPSQQCAGVWLCLLLDSMSDCVWNSQLSVGEGEEGRNKARTSKREQGRRLREREGDRRGRSPWLCLR